MRHVYKSDLTPKIFRYNVIGNQLDKQEAALGRGDGRVR